MTWSPGAPSYFLQTSGSQTNPTREVPGGILVDAAHSRASLQSCRTLDFICAAVFLPLPVRRAAIPGQRNRGARCGGTVVARRESFFSVASKAKRKHARNQTKTPTYVTAWAYRLDFLLLETPLSRFPSIYELPDLIDWKREREREKERKRQREIAHCRAPLNPTPTKSGRFFNPLVAAATPPPPPPPS